MAAVHPAVLAELPNLPFFRTFGVDVIDVEVGRVLLRMHLDPAWPVLGAGVIPGAYLAALTDVTAATAVRVLRTSEDPEFQAISAVDAMISYLAPCRGDARAEGRVIRSGRTLVFTEVSITGDDGVQAIAARVTESIMRAE